MKKEYVAPKVLKMKVNLSEDLLQIPVTSGGGLFSNSTSFMDFGGSTGGSPIAFN